MERSLGAHSLAFMDDVLHVLEFKGNARNVRIRGLRPLLRDHNIWGTNQEWRFQVGGLMLHMRDECCMRVLRSEVNRRKIKNMHSSFRGLSTNSAKASSKNINATKYSWSRECTVKPWSV